MQDEIWTSIWSSFLHSLNSNNVFNWDIISEYDVNQNVNYFSKTYLVILFVSRKEQHILRNICQLRWGNLRHISKYHMLKYLVYIYNFSRLFENLWNYIGMILIHKLTHSFLYFLIIRCYAKGAFFFNLTKMISSCRHRPAY